MRNLSVPHVPVVLNLSLGNCSLLRTGAVAVWELLEKEEQAGAGSQAVQGVEESFPPPSREDPAPDKTSE